MRLSLTSAVIVAILLAVSPVQATTFEAGSLEKTLEAYGLLEPNAGSLRLQYEVRRDGDVEIRVTGRRPGLKDVDQTLFVRVVALIAEGNDRISYDKAASFLDRLKFAMAVHQDRRANGAAATARRFGIKPERVEEVIQTYLSLFGRPIPLQPVGPGVKFSA